ncbi:MAG TPA: AsmA-like C-terminal region-containing protein [Methylomirabilota bacterium]|nr:AsmA-like C-terminal region-containing protein [Methylomirabilota bacterium]
MRKTKQKSGSRFWRVSRRVFRWFRITVLFTLLGLLLLALWLNHFGFPDLAKEHLVAALRERGVDLQFTRLRLLWFRGIVADNIHFGKAGDPRGLRASATEADLHLRVRPLLRRQLDVEGIVLRGGRMVVPIWGTNDTPRELNLEKINGELRFRPNDQWDLSGLTAETFGMKLTMNGTVKNASFIRQWKFGSARPKAKTPQAFWHDLVWNFEQTKFDAPTIILGTVSGDARELQTFRVNVKVNSPAMESPWGKGKRLNLSAQIAPQAGELVHAEIKLQAYDADTRWGRAESVQLDAQLTPSLTQWTPTNAHVKMEVKRAQTPWGHAASLTLQADFRPNPSEAASSFAAYSMRGQQIQTPWVRLARAEISAHGVVSSSNAWPRSATTKVNFAGGESALGRAASGSMEATLILPLLDVLQFGNTNISWWTRLDQVAGEVSARFADVYSPRLDSQNLSAKASWRAPHLSVRELDVALYDGSIRGSASLDTATRALSAEIKSDFDPQKATHLLTTNALRWLKQFQWQHAPKLDAYANIILPVWTNEAGWKDVQWSAEVWPALVFGGTLQLGSANFRGADFLAAESDFNYSNRTWRLPNLVIVRPEGKAHIAHVSREQEGQFQFVIDSTIDPRVLRPLFEPGLQQVIDDFTMTSPPHVRAEVAGHWSRPEQTSVRASLAATNLGYRFRPVLSCRALMTLTNQVLSFVNPDVIRTEGSARADSVVIDIPRRKMFINNGSGRLNPADITHVISPDVESLMTPYRFIHAPQSRASGMIDLEDGRRSDLHFEIAGGPFEWRSLRFQQITGVVHWGGPFLTISNVLGSMHGGNLEGSMRLDFTAKEGADFAFRTDAREIDLHSLVSDLGNPTNKLEGSLGGTLVITDANSEEPRSWFGYGDVTLRDGLLWEVPVFGLFSPILNKINEGSGNQRAKEATATFVIANSVIATSDLSIRASAMQLNYQGTVDFDARINGRMEAELFRNTPGFGPVVSKMFWPVTKLFEYKVTGTFSKPKSEPLFIPKILLMPFHPLRTMRELLEGDKEEILPGNVPPPASQ